VRLDADAYLFRYYLPRSKTFDMADVEMKDAKTNVDAKDDVATPPLSPVAEIKSNVTLIERAVSTIEPRFTIRVLRSLTALRKRLDDKALCDAVSEIYPQGV
jgi:26S proteasome regulatory subunit N3